MKFFYHPINLGKFSKNTSLSATILFCDLQPLHDIQEPLYDNNINIHNHIQHNNTYNAAAIRVQFTKKDTTTHYIMAAVNN